MHFHTPSVVVLADVCVARRFVGVSNIATVVLAGSDNPLIRGCGFIFSLDFLDTRALISVSFHELQHVVLLMALGRSICFTLPYKKSSGLGCTQQMNRSQTHTIFIYAAIKSHFAFGSYGICLSH